MNTPYNNPRVEKYYPIEGRNDFFKYAVMNGNEIAEDYDNNKMIFQEEKTAQRIVKARLSCNKKTAQFMKPKKYNYYLVIQEFWGGWEDVIQHEATSQFEAINTEEHKGDLKAHKENSGTSVRVVRRKELNPNYKEVQ